MIYNRFGQFMIAMLVLLVGFSAQAQDDDGYRIALWRIEQIVGTNVGYLNLSRLDLTQLPPEIGQLTNLQSLYLSHNNLTSLPPEIGQLTNLQVLALRHNNLTSLPPEIGQLSSLQELDLRSNALTSLPPEIGQLTQLRKLDLNFNAFTSLPPEIGQLTQLERLSLDGNNLPTVPIALQRYGGLRTQIQYIINPTLYGVKQVLIVLIVGLILAGLWFKFEWSRTSIQYLLGAIGGGIAGFLIIMVASYVPLFAVIMYYLGWKGFMFGGVLIGIIIGLRGINRYRASRDYM